MFHDGFVVLPIVIARAPGKGLRWVHLLFSAPLVILAAVAAYWGDETADYVFALAAGISTLTEIAVRWINHRFGHRYEVGGIGVRYRDHRENWSEPMSAYSSLDWHEEMLSSRSNGQSVLSWQVELHHRSDPKRSVRMLGVGWLSGNRDRDREAWQAMAKALKLPARQIAGAGVAFSSPTETAPVWPGTETPAASCEVRVGRSGWAWVLPVFFSLMGTTILYQQIARGGWEGVIAEDGLVLYAALAALAILWGWTLIRYCIHVEPESISVTTCLGPIPFRSRVLERRHLRQAAVYTSAHGLASIALEAKDQPPLRIPYLSHSSAWRIERCIKGKPTSIS